MPVTSPIELHVVFDRETCREEMMQQQADITQQQLFDKAKQTMARLFPQVETGYQEYIKAKRLPDTPRRTKSCNRHEATTMKAGSRPTVISTR